MKRWQKIALNVAGAIGVALLVWYDPGYVVSGVDVLGWLTELLFAASLGYVAVSFGRYVERRTGGPLLGAPTPLGASFIVVPLAVLLHLAIQLIKNYPVALYFDIRFGVFVAVAAFVINHFWASENPAPFVFLDSGRRGMTARTNERGQTVAIQLITVRRRYGDLLREVEIDVRRNGWIPDPAAKGSRWTRLMPSGMQESVSVSPGFFAIDGTSQGPLDGGAAASEPGSWSTVAFSTEGAVAPPQNPYDR
jgi:hypothetical protein